MQQSSVLAAPCLGLSSTQIAAPGPPHVSAYLRCGGRTQQQLAGWLILTVISMFTAIASAAAMLLELLDKRQRRAINNNVAFDVFADSAECHTFAGVCSNRHFCSYSSTNTGRLPEL